MGDCRSVYAGFTITRVLCTFVLSMSVTNASGQASYQCEQDGLTKTEQVICDVPKLSLLDRELSDLYLSVDQRDIPAQRAWLHLRNQCGIDEACIFQAYADRIRYLEKALNYLVTDLNRSLTVRNPLLAFVFGKGEGYAIPRHSQPVCSKEDLVLNKAIEEVVVCSAGCSSFACPIEYFVGKENLWLSLDLGLTDRAMISVSESLPEQIVTKYGVDEGMFNGWKPLQTNYVGQGIPMACEEVTYYLFIGNKYKEVLTEVVPRTGGNMAPVDSSHCS